MEEAKSEEEAEKSVFREMGGFIEVTNVYGDTDFRGRDGEDQKVIGGSGDKRDKPFHRFLRSGLL